MAFHASYDSTKLRNLLKVVEDIRGLQGPSDEIQLPDIVVCGVQSAGKSSVLQALAGVNLPRSPVITTRIALRLSLVRDPELGEGQSYALIGKLPTLDETGERVEEENLDFLGEKIEQLTMDLAGPGQGINSKAAIHLKLVRNHGPTLTLVDLPGISYADDETEDLADKCLKNCFADPDNRHIVLLVLSAAGDVASYSSLKAARGIDMTGERTMCVLTNVDRRLDPNLSTSLQFLHEKAKLGVFPVYNPNDKKLTPTEARQLEASFFEELAPEHGLADGEWGIESLGLHLMEAQTPVVEAALKTLGDSISTDLSEKGKLLSEMELTQDKTKQLPPRSIILNTVTRVQDEFRERATASSAPVSDDLNIALRTDTLYSQFQENVRGITPKWLSDDFKPEVERSIQHHRGGDVCGQTLNAEVTVFRKAFDGKLAKECTELVRNVRLCVKDVLETLLHSQEGAERPALPSYLCKIFDEYLQKRNDKAEEMVNYLAKAELTRRLTKDESYDRIVFKVERLAEQMSVHRGKMPFQENHTDVPPEQSVEIGADDDVAGIPLSFIKDYYHRVQEQFKNDRDVYVAKSQVSLHAYSKIMTRRIIDVVPMQAHLLLVTDVFDVSARPRTAVGSYLSADVMFAIEGESAEELKRMTAVDPEMEARIEALSTKIRRLEAIGQKISRALFSGAA